MYSHFIEYIYIGVTAVEDQLVEDVVETITQMQAAGIRVWMLTGDKQVREFSMSIQV